MIGIGVIGYGYWGPNLVRNFMDTPDAEVRAVSDSSSGALAKAAPRCPAAKMLADPDELIASTDIDAVVIATPVTTHYELARKALEAGKHVLLTKPMTATTEESAKLVELAASKPGQVLAVDHTFIYTGAVRKMRELIEQDTIGTVFYYDSVRVNLGLFQSDVDVIWDLAPHDLSILDYLVDDKPAAVSAHGMSHVPGQPENIAYVTVLYPGKMMAHVHVNWLAPVKIRQTLIGGSRRMIVYNDMEPSEKVKVYDSGVELAEVETAPEKVYQLRVGYRTGDMSAPKLSNAEALKVEARHFVDCVSRGARPITDGESGLRVVRILEAATRSMKIGKPVELASL